MRCNVAQRTFGNVMHEIGHAMGLFHEHQRPDRNDFVRVTGTGVNFDRQTSHGVAAIGRYDLGSIMHYSPSSNLRVRGSSGRFLTMSWRMARSVRASSASHACR